MLISRFEHRPPALSVCIPKIDTKVLFGFRFKIYDLLVCYMELEYISSIIGDNKF